MQRRTCCNECGGECGGVKGNDFCDDGEASEVAHGCQEVLGAVVCRDGWGRSMWSRGWKGQWEGVDWEGGQMGPRERMGAWRWKLKGEWPACGCHTLGARGRRRRVNRGGRSGGQRDWLGRWQRYGIGYSTNGRRQRSHQRWCNGRSPGRMTNPVVCVDGGQRESGGK
eukprot:scaffold13139_cov112-Amphora_coffeaeformis.AAC.2